MGLEQVFQASWTLRGLRSEPLGLLLEAFCDWLLSHAFSIVVTRTHLGRLLHLNRWLAKQGWHRPDVLSRKEVEAFLGAYAVQCRNRGSLEEHLKRAGHSINRFVAFLRDLDIFDPLPASPAYQPLLDGYLTWMREYRHVAEGTIEIRRHSVRRFLVSLGEEAATIEGLAQLNAERIESFFVDYARDMGRSARRSMQAALRTFLRFCFYEGYIQHRLDHAVPTLRTYKLAQVPRGIDEEQAHKVLDAVDRDTAVGRRNYAILMLLHTYGVRGGQIRKLRLDDIEWSRDRILFRAMKGGKDSLLPLTTEAGESLLDYLRDGRPPSAFSEVFLTSRAPYHPLPQSSSLSEIVRRHIHAAGLEVPHQGACAFRHAFATRMVGDGHSLKAVADILGHRCLSTTFIYTKVDFKALDQVALEWPVEENS